MQTYHPIELEDLDSELPALSPPPTVLNRKLKHLKKKLKKIPVSTNTGINRKAIHRMLSRSTNPSSKLTTHPQQHLKHPPNKSSTQLQN